MCEHQKLKCIYCGDSEHLVMKIHKKYIWTQGYGNWEVICEEIECTKCNEAFDFYTKKVYQFSEGE